MISAVKADSLRELAISALALHRFRLAKRVYPSSLQDLIPTYLAALPTDCFDGAPLRYRLKSDDSFLLYSVGEDCKDDGGDPSLSKQKSRKVMIWDGRDAVWPAAAFVNALPMERTSRK